MDWSKKNKHVKLIMKCRYNAVVPLYNRRQLVNNLSSSRQKYFIINVCFRLTVLICNHIKQMIATIPALLAGDGRHAVVIDVFTVVNKV